MPSTNKEFAEIVTILAQHGDERFVKAFLLELLTADEALEISRRWKIVKMLREGVPQREIARKMHASLCNITRGSKELKKRNSALARALELIGSEAPPDEPA